MMLQRRTALCFLLVALVACGAKIAVLSRIRNRPNTVAVAVAATVTALDR